MIYPTYPQKSRSITTSFIKKLNQYDLKTLKNLIL